MDKKINEYLAWKGTYAPRAAVNYRRSLECFIKVCGKKDLCKYKIGDWVKYSNWLSDRGYAMATIQLASVALHNFLKYWKLKGANCLSPEFIRVRRVVPHSHRAAEEDEVKKIIAAIPEHTFIGLRDRLIVSMLWDTGMRISELCSLNTDQMSRQSQKTTICNKKNSNNRIIVWSDETHALLCQYLPLRAIISSQSAVFIGVAPKGVSRLTTRSIERTLRGYVKSAGLCEKITPHSFRHGWAHYRRDRFNAQLPFIQKALGHTSPLSTFIYEQYSDKEFENTAKSYLEETKTQVASGAKKSNHTSLNTRHLTLLSLSHKS